MRLSLARMRVGGPATTTTTDPVGRPASSLPRHTRRASSQSSPGRDSPPHDIGPTPQGQQVPSDSTAADGQPSSADRPPLTYKQRVEAQIQREEQLFAARRAVPRPSLSVDVPEYHLPMSAHRQRYHLHDGNKHDRKPARPVLFARPTLYKADVADHAGIPPSSSRPPVSPRWIAPQLRNRPRSLHPETQALDSLLGGPVLGGLSVNSPASMFSEPIDYQTRVAAKIEQETPRAVRVERLWPKRDEIEGPLVIASPSSESAPAPYVVPTCSEEAMGEALEWEIRRFFLKRRDPSAEGTRPALDDLLARSAAAAPFTNSVETLREVMPRPPGSSSSYLASTSLPPVPISFVHGVLTAYTAMLLPSGRRTRDSLRKLSLFCAAITTDQTGSWEDPLVVARTLRLLALATQNERMPAPSVVKSCRYTTHYLVRKITAEAFEWNVAGGVCDKTKLAETLAGLPTSIRTLPIWTKIDDNLEPIYDVLAGFIALLQPSGRPTAEQIKQLYTFCSTINRDEQGPWADPVVVARTIRLLDLAITHEKPKPSAKRLCRSRRRDLVDKITAEGFVWDLQSREEGHKALFEDTIALLPEEIKTLPIWTKIDDQAWATPNPAQPLTSIPVPARPVASEEPLDPPRSTRTSPIQDLSISVRKKEDSSSFVPSNSAPAHPRQQLAQTAAEREAEGAAREWEIRQFFLQHRDLTAEHTQIALKDLLARSAAAAPFSRSLETLREVMSRPTGSLSPYRTPPPSPPMFVTFIHGVLTAYLALVQPSARPNKEQIKKLDGLGFTIKHDETGSWADPVVVARTMRLMCLAMEHERMSPSKRNKLRGTMDYLVAKITAEGFEWDVQSGEEGNRALFEETVALLPDEIRALPIWAKIGDQAWTVISDDGSAFAADKATPLD